MEDEKSFIGFMLILGSKNNLNVPHSWPCSSRNAINVESLSLTSRKKSMENGTNHQTTGQKHLQTTYQTTPEPGTWEGAVVLRIFEVAGSSRAGHILTAVFTVQH